MENISIQTDFEAITFTSNIKTLDAPQGMESYHIRYGANYIFISNENNQTVRFSPGNTRLDEITEPLILDWMKRIKILYPNF